MDKFTQVFSQTPFEEEAFNRLQSARGMLEKDPEFLGLHPDEQKNILSEFDRRTADASKTWASMKNTPDEDGAPRSLGGLSPVGKVIWNSKRFADMDPEQRKATANMVVDKMLELGELPADQAETVRAKAQQEVLAFNEINSAPQKGLLDNAAALGGSVTRGAAHGVLSLADSVNALLNKATPVGAFYQFPTNMAEHYIGEPQGIVEGLSSVLTQFTTMFIPTSAAVKTGAALLKVGHESPKVFSAFKALEPFISGAITDFIAFDPDKAGKLSDVIQEVPALRNPISEFLQTDKNGGAVEERLKTALEGALVGATLSGAFEAIKGLKGFVKSKVKASKIPEAQNLLRGSEGFDGSLDTLEQRINKAFVDLELRPTEEVPPTLVPSVNEVPIVPTVAKVEEVPITKPAEAPAEKPLQPLPQMETLPGTDIEVPKAEKTFFGWSNPTDEELALGAEAAVKKKPAAPRVPGTPEVFNAPGAGRSLGLLAEDVYKLHSGAAAVLEQQGFKPIRSGSGADFFHINDVENSLKTLRYEVTPGMDQSKLPKLLEDMRSVELLRSAFRPKLGGSPYERAQTLVQELGLNLRVSQRIQEMIERGVPNEDISRKMMAWPSVRKAGLTEQSLASKLDEVMPTAESLARSLASRFGIPAKSESSMAAAFKAMTRQLRSPIEISPDLDSFGKYFFAQDKIYIKDPKAIFHEIGHWGFDNILSVEDRIAFFDLLGSKYNSEKAWDRLFPFRKVFKPRVEQQLAAGEITQVQYNQYQAWMRSPNEAFADMVSKYTYGHIIPPDDFKGIIDKAKKAATEWVRERFGRTKIPADLENLVGKLYKNRVVEGFSVPTIKDREQAFASIESSWKFIDREVFMDSVKAAADFEGTGSFPKADDYLVTRIRELPPLDPKNINKFSDLVGPGRMSPEQLLEVLQLRTHMWYHGVLPEDLPMLDEVMQKIAHFAEPARREEITAELRKAYGKVVESPYGRVQDAPDGVVLNEKELFRAKSEAVQTEIENAAHFDSGAEMSYKAFVTDLTEQYRVFEAMKLERSAGDIPSVPPQLAEALQAERILRFGDESFYDDAGNLDRAKAFATLTRYLPSFSTLAAGITFDNEDGVYVPGIGYMGWSPVQYVTRFNGVAPVIGAYMLPGGKALVGRLAAKARDKTVERVMESGSKLEPLGKALKTAYNHRYVKAFHPTEGLSEEIYDVKRQYNIERMDVARRGAKIANEAAKTMSLEDRIKVTEIVTKEGNFQNYSESLKVKAQELRDFQAKVREMLVASGAPADAVNAVNADEYMHRIYTKVGGKVDPEDAKLRKIFKTIGAEYLIPRGATHAVLPHEAMFKDLQRMAGPEGLKPGMKVYDYGFGNDRFFILPTKDRPLESWMDGKSAQTMYNHEWVVDKVTNKRMVLRRDYTKQERVDMGEVMDFVPRIYSFAKAAGRDAALGRAYQRLNAITDHVKDAKSLKAEEQLELIQNGWHQLADKKVAGTGVSKYGELSGKLVSPEVKEVLSGMTMFRFESDTAASVFDKWKKLTQGFKLAKTAFNSATHGVNFVSNALFTALDGRNPITVIYNGLKHCYDKSDWYMQAVDHGMIDSGLLRADFNLDAFMRNYDGIDGSFMKQSQGMLSRMTDHAMKGLRKAARVPMYVYEKGDQIYKMGVFAQEMELHGDPKKAINAANRLFFDYRDVPRGIQFLRDSGIMPFVSYSYKAAPVLFDMARENPHRLLGMLAIAKIMNDAAFNAEYDDWEAGLAYENRVKPQYMKDRKIFGFADGLMKLPFGDGRSPMGQRFSRYFDFGRFVPGGDALNPLQMLAQYPFGFHPVITTLVGVLKNEDPYFDKVISKAGEQEYKTMSDRIQYAKDLGRFVINVWAPNTPILNPFSYQSDALGNMLTRYGLVPADVASAAGWTGTDKYGTPDTAAETLLGIFGARVRKLYPDEEAVAQMRKVRWGLGQKQNAVKNMMLDARTSPDELARALGGLDQSVTVAGEQINQLGSLQSAATVRVPGISH